MIYEKTGYVAGSMCDAAVKLSPIAVCGLIEDCVTELLGSLGIDGVTAMKKYGAMWVFSKNSIKMHRRPDWLEKFRVRCFISGHSPLRLFIDTRVESEQGEPLVSSRVEVAGIDLESGRIRKPRTVGFEESMEHPEPLDDVAITRFPKQAGELIETVRVRSTSIDYCFHTNNIEYVRFILNTIPEKELTSRGISELELHYRSQSHEGDELTIERLDAEGGRFYIVRCAGSEAVSCRLV